MAVTTDPVAFFAENAAKHLIAGTGEDPWEAAGAVFNKGIISNSTGPPGSSSGLGTIRYNSQNPHRTEFASREGQG